MKIIVAVYRAFNTALDFLTRSLLIVLTVIVFGMAISRLFNITFPWSLDLPLLLFTWVAFLSMAQASREHAHNGVDIVVRLLPEKVRGVIEVINTVLMIGFLFVISYHAYQLALSLQKRTITTLGIAYNWLIWPCVIGCVLMTVFESINLVIKALHLTEVKE